MDIFEKVVRLHRGAFTISGLKELLEERGRDCTTEMAYQAIKSLLKSNAIQHVHTSIEGDEWYEMIPKSIPSKGLHPHEYVEINRIARMAGAKPKPGTRMRKRKELCMQ